MSRMLNLGLASNILDPKRQIKSMTNKSAGSYESTVKKIIYITAGILSVDISVFDELSRVLKNSNLKDLSTSDQDKNYRTFVSLLRDTEATIK